MDKIYFKITSEALPTGNRNSMFIEIDEDYIKEKIIHDLSCSGIDGILVNEITRVSIEVQEEFVRPEQIEQIIEDNE